MCFINNQKNWVVVAHFSCKQIKLIIEFLFYEVEESLVSNHQLLNSMSRARKRFNVLILVYAKLISIYASMA